MTLKKYKLSELVNNLNKMDDESTVYLISTPNQNDDFEVVVLSLNDEGAEKMMGYTYFLEIAIMKEIIVVWRDWRKGKTPSLNEKVDAIKYYAKHDTYQPVE